jgi:hypothetical protein
MSKESQAKTDSSFKEFISIQKWVQETHPELKTEEANRIANIILEYLNAHRYG